MFPQRKQCRPRVPREVPPVREPLVRAPGRPVCTAQGPRRRPRWRSARPAQPRAARSLGLLHAPRVPSGRQTRGLSGACCVAPSGLPQRRPGLSRVPSSLSASASSVLPTTRRLRFHWRARPGAWPAPTHLERSAAGQRPRGNTSCRLPRAVWDANTVPPPETADSNAFVFPLSGQPEPSPRRIRRWLCVRL